MKPTSKHILVKQETADEMTASGLVVPKKNLKSGKVIEVSPDVDEVKEGQRIAFERSTAISGSDLISVHIDHVIGIL